MYTLIFVSSIGTYAPIVNCVLLRWIVNFWDDVLFSSSLFCISCGIYSTLQCSIIWMIYGESLYILTASAQRAVPWDTNVSTCLTAGRRSSNVAAAHSLLWLKQVYLWWICLTLRSLVAPAAVFPVLQRPLSPRYRSHRLLFMFSVADPWYFGSDPDPRINAAD